MKKTHTPGNWNSTSNLVYSAETNNTIAECIRTNKPDEEAEANAKLIAAAPDLLEALQELNSRAIHFADDHKYHYDKGNQDKIDELLAYLQNAHLQAKAAIQKATL